MALTWSSPASVLALYWLAPLCERLDMPVVLLPFALYCPGFSESDRFMLRRRPPPLRPIEAAYHPIDSDLRPP